MFTMTIHEQAGDLIWVQEEKQRWPPNLKLLLAFVLGFLALSPAILGIHWELVLP